MARLRLTIPPGPQGHPAIEGGGWFHADGGSLPHPVTVRLALDETGRLICTGIIVESEHEITAREMRFKLGRLLAEIAAEVSKPATSRRLLKEVLGRLGIPVRFVKAAGHTPRRSAPQTHLVPEPWRALLPVSSRRTPARPRTRTGPPGHDDEFYEGIAADYKRALREQPQRPIRALMEARGYSEAQMHRHLREARKRELLPATPGGRTSARKGRK